MVRWFYDSFTRKKKYLYTCKTLMVQKNQSIVFKYIKYWFLDRITSFFHERKMLKKGLRKLNVNFTGFSMY